MIDWHTEIMFLATLTSRSHSVWQLAQLRTKCGFSISRYSTFSSRLASRQCEHTWDVLNSFTEHTWILETDRSGGRLWWWWNCSKYLANLSLLGLDAYPFPCFQDAFPKAITTSVSFGAWSMTCLHISWTVRCRLLWRSSRLNRRRRVRLKYSCLSSMSPSNTWRMYCRKEANPRILGLGVALIQSCRPRILWVLWIHLVAWVVSFSCGEPSGEKIAAMAGSALGEERISSKPAHFGLAEILRSGVLDSDPETHRSLNQSWEDILSR
ncbi:uncharacterized protein BJ171DRAFT_180057 [Polychytrium aggregatum]|uniref:uncharacterized protein n=1 Tax=Polychytrium aggregatum TaxID=110093 RepID=UPI0022FDD809|nr:uncharacterized protein BJ171DRAFT_180057 [Polychytrium aggregatum]KAI9202417.1 hypothetical protein BJ171DRAFT_180057 [Polychytrium aggregatum]